MIYFRVMWFYSHTHPHTHTHTHTLGHSGYDAAAITLAAFSCHNRGGAVTAPNALARHPNLCLAGLMGGIKGAWGGLLVGTPPLQVWSGCRQLLTACLLFLGSDMEVCVCVCVW